MGIDSATFWVNLHFSKHERDFMSKFIKKDIARTKKFHGLSASLIIFVHLKVH